MTETEYETLDLSDYSTAAGAAKALYRWLKEQHDDPSGLHIWDPDEAAPKRSGHAAWTVSWEGGPYEWATALTAGESMYARELGRYGGDPQVTGFYEQNEWRAEPFHSFDLQFYNE